MSYIIPIGPYHPALEEPVHTRLYTDGEIIRDADVFVGYNHRGIEKLATERNAIQTLVLVERVCGICSHSHAFTYAMAVEAINKINKNTTIHNLLFIKFNISITSTYALITPFSNTISSICGIPNNISINNINYKRTPISTFRKTSIFYFVCTISTNIQSSINSIHNFIYLIIMVSTITKPFGGKYTHYRLPNKTNYFF